MTNEKSYAIIGLGRFGMPLAKKLAEAGKEVIGIDRDEDRVKELREYTEYAFVSQTLTKDVLEEVGVQNCDVVIVCIGERIEVSILTTLNVITDIDPHYLLKAGDTIAVIGKENKVAQFVDSYS